MKQCSDLDNRDLELVRKTLNTDPKLRKITDSTWRADTYEIKIEYYDTWFRIIKSDNNK